MLQLENQCMYYAVPLLSVLQPIHNKVVRASELTKFPTRAQHASVDINNRPSMCISILKKHFELAGD